MIDTSLLHTTDLGIIRIKKNLCIECDVVDYCKNLISSDKCSIIKRGKNFYCYIDDVIIVVNSYSYTIITAHRKGKKLWKK